MHNLSPIKKSQKNNNYFDMTLQTKNGTYRSVCFSPEKHSSLSSNYESSSPVKISKFQLKRNKRSNDDEIHINKRSKFEEPQESEVTFDIEKVQSEEKCKPGITAVSDVLQGDSNALSTFAGELPFMVHKRPSFPKARHSESKKPYLRITQGQCALCCGKVT